MPSPPTPVCPNCTVQPGYNNSNSSDPAAGVGGHKTGGHASPQFIVVMALVAILLLIGFVAKLRVKETMNVDADAGKTGAATAAVPVTIAPLPLLTSARVDFLPVPVSTPCARYAPPKAASSRLSRRLSTLIRPLRYISTIIRDPWGFIRDSRRTDTGTTGTTGITGTTGTTGITGITGITGTSYKAAGYASKRKLVEESASETGTLASLSATSLAMSAHGLELEDVRIRTEFESPFRFQAQLHVLLPPPPVHVTSSLERTRDVRSWRVLEMGGLRTTV